MRINIIILFILIIFSSIGLLLQGGIIISGLGVVMAMMVALWLLSLMIKDSSIVDIFWGHGFVIMVWFYAFKIGLSDQLAIILCTIVSIWGMRLGIYLFIRNWSKGEDKRYQGFRKEGGANYWWISLFRVFVLQGVILWILSSLFYGAMIYAQGINLFTYLGLLIWLIGFLWESIADYQMMQFKKNPQNAGKVLNTGLWKYSRHPNYFGDTVLWWGFYFVAASAGAWYYIFSPFLMSFLLIKISGVPMLEPDLKYTKPDYKKYISNTPTFFPRIPKEKN